MSGAEGARQMVVNVTLNLGLICFTDQATLVERRNISLARRVTHSRASREIRILCG